MPQDSVGLPRYLLTHVNRHPQEKKFQAFVEEAQGVRLYDYFNRLGGMRCCCRCKRPLVRRSTDVERIVSTKTSRRSDRASQMRVIRDALSKSVSTEPFGELRIGLSK